ncbi:MAG: hypothetical protein HY000_10505 [Planctomycetes bacterium]|nr:hypothetical protein [Planctomycetota bacterium]
MPSFARREIVDQDQVGIYHCIARCVRRAFLCGADALSGKSFDHRKEWIQQRLEQLAAVFAIDVCGFAVLSNHLHLVLRIRPDVAQEWSDEDVVRRWWRLFPHRDSQGAVAKLEPHLLAALLSDPRRVAEWRQRLCSLSWLMRSLCEPIARRANREDGCSGRFWEGRFKCQALLDEAAVLACSVYVDLNPIRAGVADRPETSEFTSAFERIAAREAAATDGGDVEWLCPLPDEDAARGSATSPQQPTTSPPTRRASNQGFLPMRLEDYLRLLDWTGRQTREGKRGAIPDHLQPILARLNIQCAAWLDTVCNFGRWFHRAAGGADRLLARAHRAGCRWSHGMTRSRLAFR